MSIWTDKSEEEKMNFIMRQALFACQHSLLNIPDDLPEIKEYRDFLKEVIDWIAPKVGLEGITFYYPAKFFIEFNDVSTVDKIDEET